MKMQAIKKTTSLILAFMLMISVLFVNAGINVQAAVVTNTDGTYSNPTIEFGNVTCESTDDQVVVPVKVWNNTDGMTNMEFDIYFDMTLLKLVKAENAAMIDMVMEVGSTGLFEPSYPGTDNDLDYYTFAWVLGIKNFTKQDFTFVNLTFEVLDTAGTSPIYVDINDENHGVVSTYFDATTNISHDVNYDVANGSVTINGDASETPSTGDGSTTETGDVKAEYSSEDRTDVYQVDITWGAMEFTYNDSSEVWNKDTHEWESQGEASWSASGNTIDLENHSSASVDVSLSYENGDGYDDVTIEFDNNSFTMNAPTADTDVTQNVEVTASGELTDTTANNKTIGTITIQLS